jgi:8-oxo-dGTP pyrophosphatase MutT (NUDIX family)
MFKNATIVVLEKHPMRVFTGKILAVPRKKNLKDYGLPGGKVHKEELAYDAAVRELWEETRYYAAVNELQTLFSDDDTITYLALNAVHVSLAAPDPKEPEPKFVEIDELIKGSFGEYNTKVITALITYLAKRLK